MCHYRRVKNVYLRCGHQVQLADAEIRCDAVNCKFSRTHPRYCPNCPQTCVQYHQFPEVYSPKIDGSCPACAAGGR